MTDDSKMTDSGFRSGCSVFNVQHRFNVQRDETKQFALAKPTRPE